MTFSFPVKRSATDGGWRLAAWPWPAWQSAWTAPCSAWRCPRCPRRCMPWNQTFNGFPQAISLCRPRRCFRPRTRHERHGIGHEAAAPRRRTHARRPSRSPRRTVGGREDRRGRRVRPARGRALARIDDESRLGRSVRGGMAGACRARDGHRHPRKRPDHRPSRQVRSVGSAGRRRGGGPPKRLRRRGGSPRTPLAGVTHGRYTGPSCTAWTRPCSSQPGSPSSASSSPFSSYPRRTPRGSRWKRQRTQTVSPSAIGRWVIGQAGETDVAAAPLTSVRPGTPPSSAPRT